MAGPPRGADATATWMRFSQRPRPTTTVDLPRMGDDGKPIGQVKLWVLTEAELYACRANAEREAKAILAENRAEVPRGNEVNFGYEDIYRNELHVELLALALRDVEDTLYPWAPRAKELRQNATTDELAVLVRAYDTWRRECGPVVAELTEPELEAWVKMLMEGASRVPLARLAGEAMSDLVMYLVSQLKQAHSTATGSPGSPPDEVSTPEAPEPDTSEAPA